MAVAGATMTVVEAGQRVRRPAPAPAYTHIRWTVTDETLPRNPQTVMRIELKVLLVGILKRIRNLEQPRIFAPFFVPVFFL